MTNEKPPHNHRKALGDTQRFCDTEELEKPWSKIIKRVSDDYVKYEIGRLDALIKSKKAEMAEHGEKMNSADMERRQQRFKERLEKVRDEINQSMAIVHKVPNGKDGHTLELVLDLGMVTEKDTKLRGCYLRVDLPQDFSRDNFIKVFNTGMKDYSCSIRDKDALRKFDSKVVEKIPLRTFIVPLNEILFPPRQRSH